MSQVVVQVQSGGRQTTKGWDSSWHRRKLS